LGQDGVHVDGERHRGLRPFGSEILSISSVFERYKSGITTFLIRT